MRRIEFAPAAQTELDSAATFYDESYAGRGRRFYDAVERVVESVLDLPEAGPPFPRLPARLGVRRRLVPGFPFVIAYRLIGEVVRIDAVAHVRRSPGYFLPRIR